MNSAKKHLLVFISKKFVYQSEIRRSTFSDFSRICLSTNSVHHPIFYRLIKSSKTNVDELTLKCKRYYIMEIWNCIYKTNISSVKFFLHLSSYPDHMQKAHLWKRSTGLLLNRADRAAEKHIYGRNRMWIYTAKYCFLQW